MDILFLLAVYVIVLVVPLTFALRALDHKESQFWIFVCVGFAIAGAFFIEGALQAGY